MEYTLCVGEGDRKTGKHNSEITIDRNDRQEENI
jgi:hypothetical protein